MRTKSSWSGKSLLGCEGVCKGDFCFENSHWKLINVL